MSPRAFIDSTVYLHALGRDHPSRASCLALVGFSERGELDLHASVEMVQEVTFHTMRRDDATHAADMGSALMDAVTLHPFDADVLARSLELVRTGAVRGRDAVHAATALRAGFDAIVTTDRDFDGIPGLRRIDPSELAEDLACRDP